jgi:DNA polymerase zeta
MLTIHRVPHYSHPDLTRWYADGSIEKRMRVLRYYVSRCGINLEILEAQELVARVWYCSRLSV